MNTVTAEIAPGELVDKITILRIKRDRIQDPQKLRNVLRELTVLEETQQRSLSPSASLLTLSEKLLEVNEKLWEIEDAIRICEREQSFGSHFIQLARSVYQTNDIRADLKRQINQLLGSELVEEKQYVDYRR